MIWGIYLMTPEERANDFVFNKKFYSKRTAYGNALARDLAVSFKEAQREAVEKAKGAFHKEIEDLYVEEGQPRDLYILKRLMEEVIRLTPEKVLGEG